MRHSHLFTHTYFLLLALAASASGGGWKAVSTVEAGRTSDLRGFGPCVVTYVIHSDGTRRVDETIFATASTSNAETVAGKFLHDLGRGPSVAFDQGVFAVPGGAFAVVREGAVTRLASASGVATLRDWLGAGGVGDGKAVAKAECPAWMTRFGWGAYGMGGLEEHHDWMFRACGDRRTQLDPREDFAFLKEMGLLHFDAWLQLEMQDDADGLTASDSGVRWMTKYAEEQGIPYAFRLYMQCNDFNWMSRRFGEHMERPAPWMLNGWLRPDCDHQPHISWYDADIWGYVGRKTFEQMKAFKTAQVGGWMHPAGELLHQPWYDMHADYSPMAKADWTAYLKRHGVTLAEASAMYSRGPADAFVDWEQVEPPEFATFAGLPGKVLDLAGMWLSSSNRMDWTSLAMPGNLEYLQYYGDDVNERRTKTPRHMRRSFDWDPAIAANGKVWLYFFPMSPEGVRHEVSLNGEKVADIGAWCALDVTDRLRTGVNEVEFLMRGNFWNGRVFLSTQEPAVYPNLGVARNRLYALWNDWRRDAKRRQCERVLDAMRQADPDAPIKFMAPQYFGRPIIDRMFVDWGAFAHFTGEGVWFYPWHKRYGKLWGYQGTSELGGPYTTVAEAQRSTLRVFLAGLDLHEPVFVTQTYSRNPPVRDWWLARKGLLGRLGTYDIAGPQILIYRRSLEVQDEFPSPEPPVGAKGHRVNTPWDWDIGRGTLQSLGQSALYIDDDGIAAGKMHGFKVMVDCGNEIQDPARLAQIADWVKTGGTFVAFPFSGRSTATDGDAWPIASLAGAKVAKLRTLGGTVTWKGRAYPDRGRSVSCVGVNLNEYSVELKPTDATTGVVATYENGAAAITMRKFGKGRVIWLGSAFWRDSRDAEGIWWPHAGETAFWKELLADVGADSAVCTTDDPLVWAQPYRSNDGLDAVTVLCNFNTNGVQRTRVTLRVPRKPVALTAWSQRGAESPAFAYDAAAGTCVFVAELAAQEVMVVNARVFEPADAVAYWWRENQIAWRALRQPVQDFTKFTQGKWQDPTQDLKTGWAFADSGKPCVADVLQFWGLPDGQSATIAKTFDLKDPTWLQGGRTRLVCGAWSGPNFLSATTVTLNGVALRAKAQGHDRVMVDVSQLLKPTGNVLELAFDAPEPGRKFTGLNGAIYLFHRPYPTREMPLAGLPTKLFVPKEWEGRYRVFIHMAPKAGASVTVPLGVQGADARYMRRHHHRFGNVSDIDITSLLRFGEANELHPFDPGHRQPFDFSKMDVRLELYPTDSVR